MLVAPVDSAATTPWLWPAEGLVPLAVDPTGTRLALTDGARVGVWNGRARRLEQLVASSRHVVTDAEFSPSGAQLLVREIQSPTNPALQRLRVVDIETGATLGVARLPCGCLVDAAFTSEGEVRAALSSRSLRGTWLLRWGTDGRLEDAQYVTDAILGGSADGSFVGRDGDHFAVVREGDDADTWVTTYGPGGEPIAERALDHTNALGCHWAAPCARHIRVGPRGAVQFAWAKGGLVEVERFGAEGGSNAEFIGESGRAPTPVSWLGPDRLLLADGTIWSSAGTRFHEIALPLDGRVRFGSGWTRSAASAGVARAMGIPRGHAFKFWPREGTRLGFVRGAAVLCLGRVAWSVPQRDWPERPDTTVCADVAEPERRRGFDGVFEVVASQEDVLFTAGARQTRWIAPAGSWVKGVVAAAAGTALVRLVRRDRPSAERWLLLRVEDSGRVATGADIFFLDVVAAAADGGQVAVLERTGVLTLLDAGAELSVRRRAYLSRTGPDWVAVGDHELLTSRTPVANTWVAERWLLF